MNEHAAPVELRAATGTAGLDHVLGGGPDPEPALPRRGDAGRGQDHAGAEVPARGRGGGRARPLHHAVGDGGRAARRGAIARLVARGPEPVRARHRGGVRRRPRAVAPASQRRRAGRDGARRDREGRGDQPQARGARQPVGAAAAGAEPAALPPPDPRAQALLRPAELHRAHARRPLHEAGRPAAAFDRARRRLARAQRQRFRGGAAAAARRQDARAALSRRLPRLHDREGRPARLSAPDLGRAPARVLDRAGGHRPGGARRAAGGRPRAGHQRPADRPGGRRQDHDRGALHDRGAAARGSGPPTTSSTSAWRR